jgi:hypothetical protein
MDYEINKIFKNPDTIKPILNNKNKHHLYDFINTLTKKENNFSPDKIVKLITESKMQPEYKLIALIKLKQNIGVVNLSKLFRNKNIEDIIKIATKGDFKEKLKLR